MSQEIEYRRWTGQDDKFLLPSPNQGKSSTRRSSASSYHTAPMSPLGSPGQSPCESMMSQLCDHSSQSKEPIVGQSPSEWLAWSESLILSALDKFELLNRTQKEECAAAVKAIPIFKRLFLYTFVHLSVCKENKKLNDLLALVDQWNKMDEVMVLLHHRLISDYFRGCHRASNEGHCSSTADIIKSFLPSDIVAIGARAALVSKNSDNCAFLFSLTKEDLQPLIDLLHAIIDYCDPNSKLHIILHQFLLKMSKMSELYPTSLILPNVRLAGRSVGAGGHGDVYREKVNDHVVAIKLIRKFGDVALKVAKAFSREAVTWAHLSHPNILPLYGICHFDSQVGLVSPWMENGTIMVYLKKNPDANRLLLMFDIALGLEYLHDKGVIHGDLKGENILITPSNKACLADFGLTTMDESASFGWSVSIAHAGGTLHWLAPELFDSELFDSEESPVPSPTTNDFLDVPAKPATEKSQLKNTQKTDIYAFGCLGYEIYSGQKPFHKPQGILVLLKKVSNGKRPRRPSSVSQDTGLSDEIWALIEECWHQSTEMRPLAGEVVTRLRSLSPQTLPSDLKSDWNMDFIQEIRAENKDHPFQFQFDSDIVDSLASISLTIELSSKNPVASEPLPSLTRTDTLTRLQEPNIMIPAIQVIPASEMVSDHEDY